ncbi:uncharacterized protein [Temnothorax longispinosus]|uniref:uncharacterized protein n=1 Tax=Temnothorax longispinosus TaxID=300112 RepID=UPI003A98CF8A
MVATERLKAPMRRAQLLVAIKVSRAYCTTLHAAATALSGLPPVELLAELQAKVFWRTRELQRQRVAITGRIRLAIREEVKTALYDKWEEYLANLALAGRRVVQAVQPCLREWASRRGRGFTFHITQVLTGHGCFGEYLCRIERERTTEYHHCGAEVD